MPLAPGEALKALKFKQMIGAFVGYLKEYELPPAEAVKKLGSAIASMETEVVANSASTIGKDNATGKMYGAIADYCKQINDGHKKALEQISKLAEIETTTEKFENFSKGLKFEEAQNILSLIALINQGYAVEMLSERAVALEEKGRAENL